MATKAEKDDQLIYAWKINNFSYLRNYDSIYTSFFMPDNIYKSRFAFELKITDEKITLSLLIDYFLDDNSMYDWNFKLISNDGEDISFKNNIPSGETDNDSWEKSISYQDILENGNKYLLEDCLTIIFFIKRNDSKLFDIYRIIDNTVVHYCQFSFIWNIKEFSSGVVAEKSFSLPDQENFFTISLLPSDNDDIKISITSEDKIQLCKIMRICIFLLDSTGNKRKSKMHEYEFSEEDYICVFPSFLTKSMMIAEKQDFLLNDTLSLRCEFNSVKAFSDLEYEFEKVPDRYNSKNLTTFPSFPKKILGTNEWKVENLCTGVLKRNTTLDVLQDDLTHMYKNKEMTDVTFEVEGKTILAHKCVLIARSPVFSTMFKQDMLENKKSIIAIQDMDFQTLDAMLSFMYCAILKDMNYEMVRKLLIAADKYEILSLKEPCSSFLKGSLSVKNVCDILILSDTINDKDLQRCALECFRYHAKEILVSSEWKHLESNYCGLAISVVKQYALQMNTND